MLRELEADQHVSAICDVLQHNGNRPRRTMSATDTRVVCAAVLLGSVRTIGARVTTEERRSGAAIHRRVPFLKGA